jgi:hypothetical protein
MKQFNTGTLWVDSIGEDGDRIRGMTVDAIFFDEVQDMFSQAIGNATKTLTAAKYGPIGQGVQVYFGTPKEKNSYFSSLWDVSDQRYYHLGCKNCGETFPFYLPDDKRWMDIWVSGHTIKCPLCSFEQHKIEAIERGKWVPSKDPDSCKLVGFHINQLYIPYFTKENILNLMPENNPLQTERIFKNEVIGEFYSGAGLPITRAEIYEKCRDSERSFARSISPKEKSVYLGVDWGGKDDLSEDSAGQSYSCVVILSSSPDGILRVEHAHKLRKQDFDYKKETLDICNFSLLDLVYKHKTKIAAIIITHYQFNQINFFILRIDILYYLCLCLIPLLLKYSSLFFLINHILGQVDHQLF